MFSMTLSPVELLLRACLVYVFVFALLRLSGKKHVGEMAPFDLVVLLILSECVQNAIVADDNSLTAAAIAVGTLLGLSHAVGYLTWRSKKASRIPPFIRFQRAPQDVRDGANRRGLPVRSGYSRDVDPLSETLPIRAGEWKQDAGSVAEHSLAKPKAPGG